MKDILSHYQEEIVFLREQGKKFASKYPTIADKIDFNGNRSNDPHTERIIESFAFMVAQLNTKIDNNAEHLAYYLLTGLYPGIASVFPPCSVAQFDSVNFDFLPRNSKIWVPVIQSEASNEETSDSYVFKTVYPLTIYPLKIVKLSITKYKDLRIDIKTTSVPVEEMHIDQLMFYIDASLSDNAFAIYASLFATKPRITLIVNSQQYDLQNSLELCGFNEDETAVPVSKFVNYSFHLLREVLLFPQKFMFFKIIGISKTMQKNNLKNIDRFSICISLSDVDIKLNQNAIKINSVPIVNLFNYMTNSFRFDNTKSRYLLLSNDNPYIAIHSIKEVHLIDSMTKEDYIVPQYFSFDYCSLNNTANPVYWLQPFDYDNSTYISFVDTNLSPSNTYADVAFAKTLCFNKINHRNINIDKTVQADGALSSDVQGRLILQITEPFYIAKRDMWNLFNQLAFGQLSKTNIGQFVNKLRNISAMNSGAYNNIVQSILNDIVATELIETNKRIIANARSSFVKAYTYKINVKKRLPPYATLLFKVIRRYLQNNKPINSYVDLDISVQT